MSFGHQKYYSVRTFYSGTWYDSKREANFAKELDLLRFAVPENERVTKIWRQVLFHLAGGIIYRLDFEVQYADGKIRYFEVKGFETKEWKMKLKLMKEKFPDILIEVIK